MACRMARGLKRPNQPSRRLVEAGTAGSCWLRTRPGQRSTRWKSRLRTGFFRHTRPWATACQRLSSTGSASGGHSRTSRCRMGSSTRSRWVRTSSSMRRRCRPTVRFPGTAHGCRSRPVSHRTGPYAGASSVVRPRTPRCSNRSNQSPQDHGHGAFLAADGQPGFVHLAPGLQGRLRVGSPSQRHGLDVAPQPPD